MNPKIPVTKTFLPPLEEYNKYLKKIWENEWITNNGELVKKLEERLKDYLNVKHLFFVSNGTIALQIALKALEPSKKRQIITTPFSYVATTSSIVWENFKPVFADIDPLNLTIDPKEIVRKINPNTVAILATHVFGNPCNIEKINKISQKYNLKVIYDSAHTFGSLYNEKSLASYGDISILSFHATKIFHTTEGGAIITNDDKIAHKISYMRNFGHNGEYEYWGLGINGKNSELHAAMGLANFPHLEKIIADRKKTTETYDKLLFNNNSQLKKPLTPKDFKANYSYYPVIFPSERAVLKTLKTLNQQNIFPRRYFYPSLSRLPYIKTQKASISEDMSRRIICLPLYYKLEKAKVSQICKIINNVIYG